MDLLDGRTFMSAPLVALTGATGFIGPVSYPGKGNVTTALGGVKAQSIPPFTSAY